ncbi:MAG: hypothetical protein ACI9W6_002176 [Motiliproteus sp.]|jgi:hypothetical protein
MLEPVIKNSIGKKICRKIIDLCESWFVKHILRPILFLLPPTLLTMLAVRNGLKPEVVEIAGQTVGDFLNNSALLIIIGAYFYVVVMKAIYAAISNFAKPAKELVVGDLLAIMKAIDIVVGDKTKRMSHEAKSVLKFSNVCGRQTFMKITRPDQQIPLLISGIRSVFEYMDDAKTLFRVGLLKIENNKPVDWYSFDPVSHPPRTQAAALKAPTSTVSQCIKARSIVVINDVQKELVKKTKKERRFMKGNLQESEEGSQLCYPLIHPATGKVEYVITIAGNRAECLTEKHSELYAWIINHFAVRVSLEHSLLIMKEKANEPE